VKFAKVNTYQSNPLILGPIIGPKILVDMTAIIAKSPPTELVDKRTQIMKVTIFFTANCNVEERMIIRIVTIMNILLKEYLSNDPDQKYLGNPFER